MIAMRLSKRHANQQTVSYRDFSGGLNTTDASESIAQNELYKAVNVCLDKSTGLLKTIAGTDSIVRDEDKTFDVLMVDPWDSTMLITATDGKVYRVEDGLVEVGTLTGQNPTYATWEDGLVIASGGKLQYYHGGTLETISESPDTCNGVFIRDGRIWTWATDRITLSAIGDEHNWTHNNDDASSAQFVDIGYKDRGNIKGVVALSSDVIIFKDNGHAYHLMGAYPDWQVRSIGRQLGIKNYECCLSVGNSVLVLGDGRVQSVEVTQDYGDMKAAYLSRKVEAEVRALSADTRVRYIPTENEVWFLHEGDAEFLTMDIGTNAYFKRRYSTIPRDAASLNDVTYILKEHTLSKVNSNHMMTDDGRPLEWEIQTATMVSYNDLLLKRVYVDTTPFFDLYSDQRFRFGDVEIYGRLPPTARFIYHNFGVLAHNRRYVADPYLGNALTDLSESVYHNDRHIYENKQFARSLKCYRSETRCVDHRRSIPINARGSGGVTLLNQLAFDVVEVYGR